MTDNANMNQFRAHEIEVTMPTAARMYDWYLGGEHNYTIDRTKGTEIVEVFPLVRTFARQNRDFLGRAVRYFVKHGIRQFLDIGSGVPTVGNVHEIAHSVDPTIRVVYVDNDMEAVISSRQLLEGNPYARVIEGDLLQPDTILQHPDALRMINLDEPVGLLIVAVLHFVLDDNRPHDVVRRYTDWLPSGSLFACSHGTVDDTTPEIRAQLEGVRDRYAETANPSTIRTRLEFARFFDGLELVDPGIAAYGNRVTYAVDWGATEPVNLADPARPCWWAAVGRKP